MNKFIIHCLIIIRLFFLMKKNLIWMALINVCITFRNYKTNATNKFIIHCLFINRLFFLMKKNLIRMILTDVIVRIDLR